MSLAISGTNTRETDWFLINWYINFWLYPESAQMEDSGIQLEKKKKEVNVSKPQNNICLHMCCSFKNVPVRAPIFTYLLCRAFSQIKNSSFLKKTPWWRDKAKFCSASLVDGGIHYQPNPLCQAISRKQFQRGQNGQGTDTLYFPWPWNQPCLTGYLKSVMSVHIWICLETWVWKVTSKVIAEFRQYMLPNKHAWDNKSIN